MKPTSPPYARVFLGVVVVLVGETTSPAPNPGTVKRVKLETPSEFTATPPSKRIALPEPLHRRKEKGGGMPAPMPPYPLILSSSRTIDSPITVVETLALPGCMMSPVRRPPSRTFFTAFSTSSASANMSKL